MTGPTGEIGVPCLLIIELESRLIVTTAMLEIFSIWKNKIKQKVMNKKNKNQMWHINLGSGIYATRMKI